MESRRYMNLKNGGAAPEALKFELLVEFCKSASTGLKFSDEAGCRATFENSRIYVLSEKAARDVEAGKISGACLRKPWGLAEDSFGAAIRLFDDITEPGTTLKVYSQDEPDKDDYVLMYYDAKKEQFAVLKL